MRADDTSGAKSGSGATTVGLGTVYVTLIDQNVVGGWHAVLIGMTPLVTVLIGALTLYYNATALNMARYWFARLVIIPRERKILKDPHATAQDKKRAREQITEVNTELRRLDLQTIRMLDEKHTAIGVASRTASGTAPGTVPGEAEAS